MRDFGAENYGLGIQAFLSTAPYGLTWGHDGGDPGYFSFMLYMDDLDAVLLFAGNQADIEVTEPAYFLNKVVEALAD